MSSRIRIGIIIGIVGIGLAVVGIFVLSRLVRQTLAPLPQPTPQAAITERVVVTTRDIALGTVLQSEDLRVVDVPVELAPAGALNETEAVVGKFSKVDLVEGETVFAHHLADPTNVSHDVAFIIEDYQVLMAFPANDLMSTLSVPQRGDLVDILVSIDQSVPKETNVEAELTAGEEEPQEESKLFTFDALQRVEVTALVVDIVQEEQRSTITVSGEQVAQPTPSPAEIKIQAYLLALLPQDALVLKHLKDSGAMFDIVLRAPTSNNLFEFSPVNSEYIIDRYGLEPAPAP